MAAKILDEDPIQSSFFSPLVEDLADVVPTSPALWMPKNVRTSWELGHLVDPLQRLICKRYESGLARFSIPADVRFQRKWDISASRPASSRALGFVRKTGLWTAGKSLEQHRL